MGNTEYKDIRTEVTGIQSSDIFYSKFKNNGSDDATVDGSVTPVEFTLEDIPDGDFLLKRITFLLGVDAILDLEKFGDITALTNGSVFAINKGLPQERSLSNKTNGDIILSASDVEINTVSFAAVESSILYGVRDFRDVFENAPIIINKNISITVNDDLTAIKYFKISCHGILLSK